MRSGAGCRRRLSGPSVLLLAVLVAFFVALLLWTRGGPGTSGLPPIGTAAALPTPGQIIATASNGAAETPGASGSASGGGQGDVPTGSLLPSLPTDELHTFVPGAHDVILTASSSSGRVHALAYQFRGQKIAAVYNVRTPFRVSAHVSGLNKLASIGVQVDGGGGTASCTIIVDGRTIVDRSTSGPGHVTVCGV